MGTGFNTGVSSLGEGPLVVDLETTGLDMLDSEVIGIGLATADCALYLDLLTMDASLHRQVWQEVYDVLSGRLMVAHNAPFDLYFLKREFHSWLNQSLQLQGVWDTMSMAALLDENLIGVRIDIEGKQVGALSLKALSRLFLGRHQRVYSADFANWTPEERLEYGLADVRNTYDLAVKFAHMLEKDDLLSYYSTYVSPTVYITNALEENGMTIDRPKLLETRELVDKEIQEYLQEIQNLIPPTPEVVTKGRGKNKTTKTVMVPFNPNSYAQLGEYLAAKKYRLPLTSTGKPSVGMETLEDLFVKYPDEPLWKPLFKMRRLAKLQGTYIDACLEMAWEDDTVHPEWNSTGTVTGRYSCSTSGKNKEMRHKRGPALQTIPRPDTLLEAGWEYNPREWFIAREGKTLCVADLSQAEVRMLAVRCKDKALIEAVNSGEDIHTSVAKRVFKDWDKMDDATKKRHRQAAKMVTFGIMYGIGAYGLANRLGVSQDEAEKLLSDFYATFPGVLEWKQHESFKLLRSGSVTTLFGRKRSPALLKKPPRITAKPHTAEWEQQKLMESLWKLEYDFALEKSHFSEGVDDEQLEARAVRQAINFEIQGSVAELINQGLYAMIQRGYILQAQIHDEVVIEGEDTDEWKQQAERDIRDVFDVEIEGVRFRADVHFGATWACGK